MEESGIGKSTFYRGECDCMTKQKNLYSTNFR